MASSGKKKTTMAKLMRETKLRERRLDKQAKKDARKRAPAESLDELGNALDAASGESTPTDAGLGELQTVAPASDA